MKNMFYIMIPIKGVVGFNMILQLNITKLLVYMTYMSVRESHRVAEKTKLEFIDRSFIRIPNLRASITVTIISTSSLSISPM
jgi:hypothetical protein